MLQECGKSLNDRELRWLDNIRASSDQMTYLVEELLTLARAENDQSGKEQVKETVPLSDLVTDEVLLFEPILYEAGKDLDDHITEDLLVTGDPGKLRRLVNILLDNARKYADSPSVVALRLEPEGAKRVRLTVNTKGNPSPMTNWSGSSSGSTRRTRPGLRRASAWAFPSRPKSPRNTEAACGRRAVLTRATRFSFPCPVCGKQSRNNTTFFSNWRIVK